MKIHWLLVVIGLTVAWLHANHSTAVRLKLSNTYKNGENQLAAIHAIRSGDSKRAIALLEKRLETNVFVLNYVIDSHFQKGKHRRRAEKFLADYDQYTKVH